MEKRFQQIALIAFLIPVLGLFLELSAFLDFGPSFASIYRYLAFLCFSVYLDVSPEISWFRYNNPTTHFSTNFLIVAFYLVMLAGAIFYYNSRQKETRLISFSFAVILVVHLVGLISGPLSVISYFREYYMKDPVNLIWFAAYMLKHGGMIALMYWLLKEIRKTKTLAFSTNLAGEDILHSTPKWERLFHHFMDYLLCMLIFTYIHYLITNRFDFFHKYERELGWSFYTLMSIVYRLIYYVASEGILSASPAKFLTGSRAVTFEGKNIELHNAITRTAIRFVPLEAFSFLGKSGWHDQWSSTDVVKETRTGVSGGLYFLIFPVLLLLGAGGYFGVEWYEKHRAYVEEKETYDANVEEYGYELDHLTTSHFIELEDALEPYASEKIFLKVDSIYDDKVDVAVFKVSDESPISVVETYYNSETQKQTIDISTLKKGLATDFDEFKEDRIKGQAILEGTKRYWIDNVFVQGAPVLKTSSSGYLSESGYHLELENCGWSAKLVEIKIRKGDIRFSNVLPQNIPGKDSDGTYGCGSFGLDGAESSAGNYFLVELVVRDQQGRNITYIMEGAGLNRTLKRKM